MLTEELTGPDLDYWVARANAAGSRQPAKVLRRHYGTHVRGEPADEPSKRAFVEGKLGSVLPERGLWQ